MTKNTLDADDLRYPPLGLACHEAARYIGVDVRLFMQLVSDGRMPFPKRLGDFEVWSRVELEAAFFRIPECNEPQANTTHDGGSSDLTADKVRPHVYSPAKLSKRWGCSVGHVHKLIESGQVKAFRVVRLVRILTENVEKFEDKRRRQAENEAPEPATLDAEDTAKPIRKKAAPKLPFVNRQST